MSPSLSCAWHTSGFPGCLAALAHENPTKALSGLEDFKQKVDAVVWHEKSGCSKSVAMAKRSLIKSQLMDWCVKQGEATNWETISQLLQEFVRLMYTGGLQTVINERINQRIRDLEERQTPSKETSRIARWYEAATCGLIESYGRKNVEVPHSEVSFSRDIPVESLFVPPSTMQTDLPLDKIIEPNQWQTWTAQSIKRAYHEQELMSIAYKMRDEKTVSLSWHTSLLPTCQIILYKPVESNDGVVEAFFVLWNTGGCVSTWPVRGHSEAHMSLDPKGTVQYKVITDINKAAVLPTRGAGPLRASINRRQGKRAAKGCQFMRDGDAVPVLEWQRRRGFANVDESTLRLLAQSRDAPPLPADIGNAGSKEERLVCQILMAEDQNITFEDISVALSLRRTLELEDTNDEVECVPSHLLDEGLNAKERAEAVKRSQEGLARKKDAAVAKRHTQELLEKVTPHVKTAKKRKTTIDAVIKHEEKYQKNGGKHWFNTVDPGKCLEIITQLKPPRVVVFTNQ